MNEELFKKLEGYVKAYEILDYLIAKGGIAVDDATKIKDMLRAEIDTVVAEVLPKEEKKEEEKIGKAEVKT
jgi:hypothetical protein